MSDSDKKRTRTAFPREDSAQREWVKQFVAESSTDEGEVAISFMLYNLSGLQLAVYVSDKITSLIVIIT